MSHLKKENMNKCFSLLRDFIAEAEASNPQKGAAKLALNQLQKITAGTAKPELDVGGCQSRPRADGAE